MKIALLTLLGIGALTLASFAALRCLNAYVDARVREHDARASFELLRTQHEALSRTIYGAVNPAFVCYVKAR
jgi:hypothetical protein